MSIQWVVKLIQVSTLSFLFSVLHFPTSMCSQVMCVWFYHFIHQDMCEMRPRSMVLLVLLVTFSSLAQSVFSQTNTKCRILHNKSLML